MMSIDELSRFLRAIRPIFVEDDLDIDPLARYVLQRIVSHLDELQARRAWYDARACPVKWLHRRWHVNRGTWRQCLRCKELAISFEQNEQQDEQKSA